MDEMVFRPLFIYKYEKERINNVDEIMEMIASD